MKIIYILRHLVLLIMFFSVNVFASEKKLNVLAILPLSGDAAAIGTAIKNGIQYAFDDFKGEDYINLRFEDDGGLPKNTVSALHQLKSLLKPDIVISASSATSKAISQITENMGVPLIAIATDEEISKGKNFAFNFWLTPDDAVSLLLKEAKRRGYKNVAMFSSIHPGTNSLKRAISAQVDEEINIVYDEEVDLTLRDFKSIISKFRNKTKNTQIDAVLTNVFFGQVGVFSRQLRELGFKQDLFCAELFEDEGEVASSGGALYGQWYVQADDPSDTFLSSYKSKYPKSSYYGASNGADAIKIIISGIKDGNYNSKDLTTYLKSIKDFEGYSGSISSKGDMRFKFPATIKLVTKDGFIKCGEECAR